MKIKTQTIQKLINELNSKEKYCTDDECSRTIENKRYNAEYSVILGENEIISLRVAEGGKYRKAGYPDRVNFYNINEIDFNETYFEI